MICFVVYNEDDNPVVKYESSKQRKEFVENNLPSGYYITTVDKSELNDIATVDKVLEL